MINSWNVWENHFDQQWNLFVCDDTNTREMSPLTEIELSFIQMNKFFFISSCVILIAFEIRPFWYASILFIVCRTFFFSVTVSVVWSIANRWVLNSSIKITKSTRRFQAKLLYGCRYPFCGVGCFFALLTFRLIWIKWTVIRFLSHFLWTVRAFIA